MKPEHVIATAVVANAIDAKAKKAAVDRIPEGYEATYEVFVRVVGSISRGQATTVKPTARLLSKAVIAELLRRCGVTREAAERALLEIATESIAKGATVSDKLIDTDPQLLAAIKRVEDQVVKELPMDTRAGKLSVHAIPHFDLINVEDETASVLPAA